MGLFDRRQIKPGAETSPPERDEPQADSAVPTTTVPAGHRIDIFRAIPVPRVLRTPGGSVIAHLGLGSDEPPEVLEGLLDEVETALSGAPAQVLLSMHRGTLSELFAPADPAVLPVAGVVLWAVHAGSLAGWIEDPVRLQALLQRIHRIGTSRRLVVQQYVYWMDEAKTEQRLELELLRGLGLEVRLPEKDGAILAEVHRPEGIILSVLTGRIHAPEAAPDPYPRTVNEEKDRAEAEGDRERRERVEERERAFLAKRIVETGKSRAGELPAWAPNLCRLLLEVATTGSHAAWKALHKELAGRSIPLLLIVDPATRGVAPRTWPGQGPALAAYPDRISLEWTAQDTKIPPGSFAIASTTPRILFDWAAESGLAVAINVYRDRASPLYVMFPAEKMKSLASGKDKR